MPTVFNKSRQAVALLYFTTLQHLEKVSSDRALLATLTTIHHKLTANLPPHVPPLQKSMYTHRISQGDFVVYAMYIYRELLCNVSCCRWAIAGG